MMARQASKSIGGSVLAAVCALFLGLAAQAAESPYDSTSLNNNLHNQCTSFSVTLVNSTNATLGAECNKEGDTPGSVSSTRNSTTIDLRDEVVWSTTDEEFTWDGTLDDDTDISRKCSLRGTGVTVSSTDVTLNFRCLVDSTRTTQNPPANADLPLNAELKANNSGELGRR